MVSFINTFTLSFLVSRYTEQNKLKTPKLSRAANIKTSSNCSQVKATSEDLNLIIKHFVNKFMSFLIQQKQNSFVICFYWLKIY